MYFVAILFWLIPLIFSHTFARLWSGFILDNGIGHFESLKMHFFLILLILSLGEMLLQKWRKWKIFFQRKDRVFLILGSFLFLFIAIVCYPYMNIWDLMLGVWEKQHGILLPIGLILLSILLSMLEKSEIKKIGFIIIFSGCIVALNALIESRGYNIFTWGTYGIRWSWWDIRSTSTLWNPNYVAGYLLIILPILLGSIVWWWKYILSLLVILGIIATKSIIAIAILWTYLLYLLWQRLVPKKIGIYLPLIIGSISLFAYILYHGSEKWLSLSSRFILMKHTLWGSFDSFVWVLFWHWPDAIIRFFSEWRPPEINAYFPSNMIIDSSHNIFIDIFTMYGLIGITFFLFIVVNRWKYLDHISRTGLILWLSFLSLNVFVISHMILIIYLLSYLKKSSET